MSCNLKVINLNVTLLLNFVKIIKTELKTLTISLRHLYRKTRSANVWIHKSNN